jgi:DNA-binding SARP family transcriptional activator
VYVDDQLCRLSVKRAEALLYYCLSARRSGHRRFTRRHLCDLFWPDEEDEQHARQRLNDTLWRLRRDLQKAAGATKDAPPCLLSTPETVEFNLQCAYDYDVEEFERLVDTATGETALQTLERAGALYRGGFLETFDSLSFGADFELWLSERQATLASHYHKLLHLLSIQYMARGDWSAAIEHLHRLQAATPEEQAGYGLLMISHAVTGQIAQAERAYRQYVEMANTVLHRPPNTAMERLHKIIQDRQFTPQHALQLVDNALRAPRKTMEAPLQEALLVLLKAFKAKELPAPSPGYHRVWQRAKEEARRHGCSLIGLPHLFLALCADSDDAVEAIRDSIHPMNLDDVVQGLHFVLGEEAPASAQDPTACTLELRHVCQVARDFAEDAEAEAIDVRHLWVALLKEEYGVLGQVLERYGINRSRLLEEIPE